MKRNIIYLSDGTGITAETLGNSLISQFESIEFNKITLPYIDTAEKAVQTVIRINDIYDDHRIKPIVFQTVVDPRIGQILKSAQAVFFDLFNTFLAPLEVELGVKSSYTVGKSHGVVNAQRYSNRIEAVDYALMHDDGVKVRGYDKADIILIGVSRSGKTPSCLYLALQFGIYAANYPFTDDDLQHQSLPKCLTPYREKLFGLTINPERLQQIRHERRPDSRYASAEQCRIEIAEIETLYQKENIPYLNSTRFSIEEICTKILSIAGIARRI
ncbi:MAG: kinase/pyrophosphorylase [Legionellaceae bacterium]|nr:kinase/pyrophosphorylase [Legionellaceae bacterium]